MKIDSPAEDNHRKTLNTHKVQPEVFSGDKAKRLNTQKTKLHAAR